jgi:hypothetical protein
MKMTDLDQSINQDVTEAAKHGLYYNVNKRKKAGTSRDADSPKAPTAQAWKDAAKTAKKEGVAEGHRDYDDNRTGFGDQGKREFKRREMEHELGHETNNYAVAIDGKTWKVFATKSHAEAVARSLQNKGKKASVHETGASISESASDGATNAANMGVGAVYNNKPPKQPKNKDGTAKNALDMKSTNLLTGGSIKRS